MYWVAIKVLFLRQMFGMRHRLVMLISTLIYTCIFLLLLRTAFPRPGEVDQDVFEDFGETRILNPLDVMAVPDNAETKTLILNAVEILKRKHNVSVVNLQLAESLARSVKTKVPLVGVELHEMTSTKLEYTLRPVLGNFARKGLPAGFSLLSLQFAIDSAYVQTYFPKQLHSFPSFQQTTHEPQQMKTVRVVGIGMFLGFSLLLMMSMLATYIIRERLSGVRELLCVNGLPRWMANTSWLIFFTVISTILSVLQWAVVIFPEPSISPTVLFFLLIIYGWTAVAFVALLSNIFSSQLVAVLMVVMYWFVTSCIGFSLGAAGVFGGYYAIQCLFAMLPNWGLVLFFRVLLEFYWFDEELSFGTLFSTVEDYVPAGAILILMLVGIVIILALSFYLDAVKPGPYGRPLPWYLFKRKDELLEGQTEPPSESNVFFEKFKTPPNVGINCINIVKIFGTNKALNNANLMVIKNKVTVLLGHNGAGKTTLFSILCGMIAPTQGRVYTEDYNVFDGNNLREFRKVLGYCPQENLVLNELSVQEHLIIFGLLKGLTVRESRRYSDKWTKMFGMYDVRHKRAKVLSGGTKRKLCLAVAMTGNPKYLLLDEPSAGMDIESTRTMMDVILKEKGKCTVVITTHNMDEAEILADYIAILASGRIKCFGTVSFLKKTIDTGYRLSCSAINKNTEAVVKTIYKNISGASVLYKTSRSVTVNLPSNQKSNIPDLLRRIEDQYGDTVSTSLSVGTLDDVFIKVQKNEGVKVNVEEVPYVSPEDMNKSGWNFEDLLKKRLKWLLSVRMVTMILLVILLPNLGVFGGIMSIRRIIRELGVGTRANSTQLFEGSNEAIRQDRPELKSILFDLDTPHDTLTGPKTVSKAYKATINAVLHNATIITHTVPFQEEDCIMLMPWLVSNIFFFLVGPLLLIASSYFIVFPHQERMTLFKHLQYMTGLLPLCYWMVNLLFDIGLYLISLLVLVILVACTDHMINLLLHPSVLSALITSLFFYGLSSILLSYTFSFFARSSALPIILLILGTIVITMVFLILSYRKRAAYECSYFIPWPVLWNAMDKTFRWATDYHNCQCQECDELDPLFPRLRLEIIAFVGQIVVYFLVLLSFDHGLGKLVKKMLARMCYGKIQMKDIQVDPAVALEKELVNKLDREDDHPQLVCYGLGKKFSYKKVAVYDVTFTAERGECFGLVGVNGAGKTTTFGMLAALLPPSKGTAAIQGKWKVTGCNYNYLKRIGYCPQYEGLLGELSAVTIITLFGRLKGVRRNQIRPLVDRWITTLDMVEIARKPCRNYSGGNKRKLSVAMAMIGNPSVVLLDEPTAGVDAVVRRKIWEILTMSLEEQEQTIILTSHTMTECEAICDRLTIMVAGVMKCLGPIPVLKKTFGKSCTLEVKFTTNSTPQQQSQVQSKVESIFAGNVQLEDTQPTRVVYSLKTENVKMYDVFNTMSRLDAEYSAIEDFNLSDTPLEQVFLKFAKR